MPCVLVGYKENDKLQCVTWHVEFSLYSVIMELFRDIALVIIQIQTQTDRYTKKIQSPFIVYENGPHHKYCCYQSVLGMFQTLCTEMVYNEDRT